MEQILPPDCITGIPQFDEEHRIMALYIDELRAVLNTDHALIILDKVIGEWVVHMVSEEKFMLDIGYPGLMNHIAEHSKFLECLRRIKWGIDAKTFTLSADLLDNLRDTVLLHMRTHDVAYGKYALSRTTQDFN